MVTKEKRGKRKRKRIEDEKNILKQVHYEVC